jgi:hypothetical protein
MPTLASQPVRFTPRGLVDAYDSTDQFLGSCTSLQNLVFDPSNPEIVIARPGVGNTIANFSGISGAGFISVQIVVGGMIYGMVASSLTAGHDQPFIYNIATSSFVAVTGLTSGNSEGRPTSPATAGAWAPPTMAIVGTYLLITHPGYATGMFGAINLSTNAYTTQNLATHALPSTPTCVANLNNRAYYSVGNMVYYSDVLLPLQASSAGQSLTLGDNSAITVLSGLPVQTTTAGVVSALLAFKQTQIWQITGDAAITGSLSLNYLSLNIGTAAPRSVAPSPLGTFFIGPDSAYVVNPLGGVMPVTNTMSGAGASPDIRAPFGNVTIPTRAAASFAGNIYRVCFPTIVAGISGIYDYWFDTRKLRWNGPHTFNYDCASSAGNYFILSGQASGAALFNSVVFPSTGTPYLDNGASYTINLRSSDFQKDGMAMKSMMESTIELASVGTSALYTVSTYSDAGNFITSANVLTQSLRSVWGSFLWGLGYWSSSISIPTTYRVNWTQQVIFNRLSIGVTCTVQSGVGIGTFYGRFEKLGYTLITG